MLLPKEGASSRVHHAAEPGSADDRHDHGSIGDRAHRFGMPHNATGTIEIAAAPTSTSRHRTLSANSRAAPNKNAAKPTTRRCPASDDRIPGCAVTKLVGALNAPLIRKTGKPL